MASYDNKYMVEMSVFDGGLVTKAQPINLLPDQSPDLKNVLFDDYGTIRIRSGIKTHNSSPMSGSATGNVWPLMGLASYKPSTMSAQLLAVSGQGVYVLTGVATTPVAIASAVGVMPLTGFVETVQFQEVLFFVAQDTQPYKFNGNNFTKMGVSAPTWTPSVASAASGSLTGEYQYVFWGVNSYAAEGDYGTPSTVVTFTSGRAQVDAIATAPISAGINTWKVGRNTAGASGIYWYLTDIANGVTSFTDNAADSSLTELAPTDQGYPRQFRFITASAGRVWGAIEDYLWYSNINQPEEFPSTNFIRVGRGDGMNISSITPFMGMIVISKSDFNGKNALYTLAIGDSSTFTDPENWYLKLVSNQSGSESHRAAVPFSNYLLLPNRHGLHLFDGSSVHLAASESFQGAVVSENIANPVSDRFQVTANGVAPIGLKTAAAIVWGGRIFLSHSRDEPTGNTNTLVYDYQRTGGKSQKNGAWSEIPTLASSQFVIHEGRLFGATATYNSSIAAMKGGYINEWDNGVQYQIGMDFGSRIAAHYVTAPIHGMRGHEGFTKDFRWVIFSEILGTQAAPPVVTITFYVDGTSLSTATLVHTETYTTTSTGRDYKVFLPAVASGKRLWIKYAWSGPSNSVFNDADVPKLSRIKIFYATRGIRNG